MKNTKLSIVPIIYFFLLTSLLFNTTSCVKEDNRLITQRENFILELPNFSAITLDFPANIVLQQGNQQEIKIYAQPEIFEAITKTVNNGEWLIDLANFRGSYEKVTIEITVPTLSKIATTSTGDFSTIGSFEGLDILVLETTSTGDIQFQGNAQEIHLLIDGTGDVDLTGNTQLLMARLESIGNLAAFGLTSAIADIHTSSTGDAEVRVEKELNAVIKSIGDITYIGHPQITSNISGIGNLRDNN